MNRPTMDEAEPPKMENPRAGIDESGKKWSHALLDNRGRIMAGYDEGGTFRCFVDSETLFAGAMATILTIQGEAT